MKFSENVFGNVVWKMSAISYQPQCVKWNEKTKSTFVDNTTQYHDDIIKWKYFPRYWPFVRGIHRSPVNSPRKGLWCRTLLFSFICAWINGWANDREAGDLRRHSTHYDVTVMRGTGRNRSKRRKRRKMMMMIILWWYNDDWYCAENNQQQQARFARRVANYIISII